MGFQRPWHRVQGSGGRKRRERGSGRGADEHLASTLCGPHLISPSAMKTGRCQACSLCNSCWLPGGNLFLITAAHAATGARWEEGASFSPRRSIRAPPPSSHTAACRSFSAPPSATHVLRWRPPFASGRPLLAEPPRPWQSPLGLSARLLLLPHLLPAAGRGSWACSCWHRNRGPGWVSQRPWAAAAAAACARR